MKNLHDIADTIPRVNLLDLYVEETLRAPRNVWDDHWFLNDFRPQQAHVMELVRAAQAIAMMWRPRFDRVALRVSRRELHDLYAAGAFQGQPYPVEGAELPRLYGVPLIVVGY